MSPGLLVVVENDTPARCLLTMRDLALDGRDRVNTLSGVIWQF